MAGYAVVAFDEDKEVSVVPSIWLTDGGTKCYWPPFRDTSKLSKAIKAQYSPADKWSQHAARVLSRHGKFSSLPNFS